MDLSPNELRNDNKSIHLFMFMFRRALHLRLVELSSSMNEKANDDLQSPISSISFGRIRLAPSSGESCLSSLLVAINKLVVSLRVFLLAPKKPWKDSRVLSRGLVSLGELQKTTTKSNE